MTVFPTSNRLLSILFLRVLNFPSNLLRTDKSIQLYSVYERETIVQEKYTNRETVSTVTRDNDSIALRQLAYKRHAWIVELFRFLIFEERIKKVVN